MKKCVLISVCILFLIVLLLYFPYQNETLQISVDGRLYNTGNDNNPELCKVHIDGKYSDSFRGSDRFRGKIVIESSVASLEESLVTIQFSDNIAYPIAEKEFGYQYTTRIHSILRDSRSYGYVIVLYNEYHISDQSRTATYNPSDPIFICIGKVSKESALELISESIHTYQ